MITTIPQVSYDDFVAAGSLGVAREKGLVKIFALLHLTFSDLKHADKNMLFCLFIYSVTSTAVEVGREGLCCAGRRCHAFQIQCVTTIVAKSFKTPEFVLGRI
jgi:hypothetical protein